MQHTFEQGQTVAVRDYRQDRSRWTPETIIAQPVPKSYSFEGASGGKWRRHADQILLSNIPIQQDTDVQFNKPTVKPAIRPHDSSILDAETFYTPTSSGNSVVPPVPLVRTRTLPTQFDDFVSVVNSE